MRTLRTLLLLAAAGLCPGPRAVAATTPRGLVVEDLTLAPPQFWRQGAMVVRAEIRNPSASPQRVRIQYGTGHGTGRYGRSGLGTASAELEVPAGGRSLCAIALPHVQLWGQPQLSAIDDSGRATEVARLVEWRHWTSAGRSAFYVSRSLSGERLRDQLGRAVAGLAAGGKSGSGAGSGPGPHTGSSDARAARAGDFADPWPGDWRAYSPFSAVFVAERDLAELSSEAKAALRDYAAAGGCVFFVGAESLPAGFADAPLSAFAEPSAAPGPARRCGLGFLAALPAEVAAPGAGDIDQGTALFVLSHVLRANGILEDPAPIVKDLAGKTSLAAGLGRPPVGLFLLLLAAFSTLAGPVAIAILARRNRRIHILWILPAISAVFCVAILLSLLLHEGVRPTLELRGAVLLDQRAGRALSLSTAEIYSPLSLDAVDLPADAAVAPVAPYRGGDLDLGRTARYDGWIAPRTPGGFHLASVRATPLRLDVREGADGAAPEVVNAFGATVERLWLADSGGRHWIADGLAPGASAALVRPAGPADGSAGFAAARRADLEHALRRSGDSANVAAALSRPGLAGRRFYIALLDAAPFEPDPLGGRKAKRVAKTVVFGTY